MEQEQHEEATAPTVPTESTLKGNLCYVELVETGFTDFMLANSKKIAEARGFVIADEYQPGLAFCLVSHMQQPIAQQALQDGVPVGSWSWLVDCSEARKFSAPVLRGHLPFRGGGAIPGFELFRICVTGFWIPRQIELLYYASLTGAKADTGLKSRTSHVVVPDSNYSSDKVDYLRNKYINNEPAGVVVTMEWLLDCLMAWEHLDERPYALPPWGSLPAQPEQASPDGPPPPPAAAAAAGGPFAAGAVEQALHLMPPATAATNNVPPTLALTATQDLGALHQPHGVATHADARAGILYGSQADIAPDTRLETNVIAATEPQSRWMASIAQQPASMLPSTNPSLVAHASAAAQQPGSNSNALQRLLQQQAPAASLTLAGGVASAFPAASIKDEPVSPTQLTHEAQVMAVSAGRAQGMSQLLQGLGTSSDAAYQAAAGLMEQEHQFLQTDDNANDVQPDILHDHNDDQHQQSGFVKDANVGTCADAAATILNTRNQPVQHKHNVCLPASQQQQQQQQQQVLSCTMQQKQQPSVTMDNSQGTGVQQQHKQEPVRGHDDQQPTAEQLCVIGMQALPGGQVKQHRQLLGGLLADNDTHGKLPQSVALSVGSDDENDQDAGVEKWQDATSDDGGQQQEGEGLQEGAKPRLGMDGMSEQEGQHEGQQDHGLRGSDVNGSAVADEDNAPAAAAAGSQPGKITSPFKPVGEILDAAAAATGGTFPPACRLTAGLVRCDPNHTSASPPAALNVPNNAAAVVGISQQPSMPASGSAVALGPSLGHASGSMQSGLGLAQGSLQGASTQDAWLNVGTLVQQLLPSPDASALHGRSRLAPFQPSDNAARPSTAAVAEPAADDGQLQTAAVVQRNEEGPDAEGVVVVAEPAASKGKADGWQVTARTRGARHAEGSGLAQATQQAEVVGLHQAPQGAGAVASTLNKILRQAQSPQLLHNLQGQPIGQQLTGTANAAPPAAMPGKVVIKTASPAPAAIANASQHKGLVVRPFKPPRRSSDKQDAPDMQAQVDRAAQVADVVEQQPASKKRKLLAPGSSAPPQLVQATKQAQAAVEGVQEGDQDETADIDGAAAAQIARRTRAKGVTAQKVQHTVGKNVVAEEVMRGTRQSKRSQKAVLSDDEQAAPEATGEPAAGAGRAQAGKKGAQQGGSKAATGCLQRGRTVSASKAGARQEAEPQHAAVKAPQDARVHTGDEDEEQQPEKGARKQASAGQASKSIHKKRQLKTTMEVGKQDHVPADGAADLTAGRRAPAAATKAARVEGAAAKVNAADALHSPAVGAVTAAAAAGKRTTRSAAKHKASRARLDSDDDSEVEAGFVKVENATPHKAQTGKQKAQPNSIAKKADQEPKSGRLTRASASPAAKEVKASRQATATGKAVAGKARSTQAGAARGVSIKVEAGQEPAAATPQGKSVVTGKQTAAKQPAVKETRAKRQRCGDKEQDAGNTDAGQQADDNKGTVAATRHKKPRTTSQVVSSAAASERPSAADNKLMATPMAYPGWACFAMTCMSEEDRKSAERQVRRLRANMVTGPTWQRGTTHVLLGMPLVRRSDKLICCMAAGAWLLEGPRYLADCAAAGKLLEPGPYEVQEGCKFDAGAPRHWRQRGGGAFKGLRVVLLGSLPAPMDASALRLLLQAGGGECCAQVAGMPEHRFLASALIKRHPPNLAVMAPDTDKELVEEVRQAGITCVTPSYLLEWVVRPSLVPLPKELYCSGASGRRSAELARLEARRAETGARLDDDELASDSV